MNNESKVCSICGKTFETWGNNPRPFKRDLCCDNCNTNIVLPIRLFLSGTTQNTGMLLGVDDIITFKSTEGLTFSDVQLMVGGYLTLYPVPEYPDFEFYCDEDGIPKGLKLNFLANELFDKLIYGNVFIIKKGYFE